MFSLGSPLSRVIRIVSRNAPALLPDHLPAPFGTSTPTGQICLALSATFFPNSARRSIAAVSISWVYFPGFHSIRNALPLHDVKCFQDALEACALIGYTVQVHDDLDGMDGKIDHPAIFPGDILAAGCHVNRRDLLVARDQLNPAEPAWRLLANPCVHLAARFALGLLVVEPVNPVDQFFSATASAPASASIMPLIVLL